MEWRIIKIGAEMFDILHAYGLGIVIACATNEPVVLQDDGCTYWLESRCISVPYTSTDLLDKVFQLPRVEEVLQLAQASSQAPPHALSLAMANLDGLLAAIFTMPRVIHTCSLSALFQRYRFDPSAIERGVTSVNGICATWKKLATHKTSAASSWLDDVLADYDVLHPQQPQPQETKKESITVAMTLDPSLGYASRQPASDGLIARKVNLTIGGMFWIY